MQVRRIDHVNIQTTQVEKMVAWYRDVLGMRTGPRPDFPFPGAWLYAGDRAVIHLVGQRGDPAVGSEVKLKLEHFALTATGCDGFEETLCKRFSCKPLDCLSTWLCSLKLYASIAWRPKLGQVFGRSP